MGWRPSASTTGLLVVGPPTVDPDAGVGAVALLIPSVCLELAHPVRTAAVSTITKATRGKRRREEAINTLIVCSCKRRVASVTPWVKITRLGHSVLLRSKSILAP